MGVYDDLLKSEDQANKYDRLLAEDADAEAQGLAGTMAVASKQDPARQAEVIDIASRERLPAAVVARNLDELKRPRVDYDALIRDNPKLSSWLGNVENASVAHDDLPSLSTWEWMLRSPKTGLQQGSAMVELGQLGIKAMRSGLTDAEEKRIGELNALSAQATGADNFWSRAYVGSFKAAPPIGKSLIEATKTGLPVGLAAGGSAAMLGQTPPLLALPEEIITVPTATWAGFRAGAVSGAYRASYELEGGNAFLEFRAIEDEDGKALDPRIAAIAAEAVGTVNGAIEVGGMGVLIKSFPGGAELFKQFTRENVKEILRRPTVIKALGQLAGRYAGVWTAEVAQEVSQEATTIIAGELSKSTAGGKFKMATQEQIQERLLETAKQSAAEFAFVSLLGPSSQFIVDASRSREATDRQKAFEAIATTDSKLRARAPDKFRDFVAKATADGPLETVYIPAEQFVAYFQEQNIDPSEALAKMPEVAKQLDVALASGGDLSIPMADFAAYIAPSQHYKGLSKNLRFNPGDMTLREAEAWQANAETLGKELEKAAKGEKPGVPDQAVYQDVLGQLVGTGMEQGTAERNATLVASVFRSLGERTGENPKDLYDRYGLKIERGQPAAAQQDAARAEVERIVADDNLLTPIIDQVRAEAAAPPAAEIQPSAAAQGVTEIPTAGVQEPAPAAEVPTAQAELPIEPEPGPSIPLPAGAIRGGASRVRISDRYVPTQWAVMEAADLAPTIDKAENQYRDRNRAAAQAQVQGIASTIDFNLLGESPLMDYGAPTMAGDGRVVGGNGRLAAIRLAYSTGMGDAYKAPLVEQAQKFGLDPAQLQGMKAPVLVRVLAEDVDVRQAAIASNEGGALQMSALETAKVDAERLGALTDYEIGDDGQLSVAGSRPAIRRWVGAMPAQQRGAVTDAQGALSAEGVRRLQNAMLYRAYGDSPTLGRLIESVDPGSRNVAAGLMRAAPRVAELRDAIAAGERYPLDISAPLQEAVEKFSRIRESGQSVEESLRQTDIFGAGLSEEAETIVRFLGKNLRSSKAIAGFLDRYLDAVERAGSPKQGDLMGDRKAPDMAELLAEAAATATPAAEADAQTTGSLFQAPAPKPWRQYLEDWTPARTLTPEEREIETRFMAWIMEDPERAMREYESMDPKTHGGEDTKGGKILNVDSIRELSEDYRNNRSLSRAVHEPASALAKAMYARYLERQGPGLVLFSAGGTGAGKSSGLSRFAKAEADRADKIYDTNLSGYASSKEKIDAALAAGREILIVYTYRDIINALEDGALGRARRQEEEYGSGRSLPVSEHVNTHVGAYRTMRQLIAEYGDTQGVRFLFIFNEIDRSKSRLVKFHEIPVLDDLEYNNLREQGIETVERAYSEGRISSQVRQGFLPADELSRGRSGDRSGDSQVAARDRERGPGEGPRARIAAAIRETGLDLNTATTADVRAALAQFQQSALDVTETPAFKAWFGDSKVVDESGEPLVVYHGTQANFDTFDQDNPRSVSSADQGYFFIDDPRNAGEHAMADWGRDDPAPNVMPVYLSLQNPLVEENIGEPSRWYDGNGQKLVERAMAAGHDGLIIGNGERNLYVVFSAAQIKSAIGNRGTFDPTSANILYQGERGATTFGADRKFTISLFEAADLSSFLHEGAHLYLEVLTDIAVRADAPESIRADMDTLFAWFGVAGNPSAGRAVESVPNRLELHAKTLGDLIVSEAAAAKPSGLIRAESALTMFRDVVGALDDPEIRRAVIAALPVDVMNVLGAQQLPADQVLHDATVLQHHFAVDHTADIAVPVDRAKALVSMLRVVARLTAKGSLAPSRVAGALASGGTATKAGDLDHLDKSTALYAWTQMSIEKKREFHEQFARGWEAYLFEGRAPNAELQSLFARFRAWLVSVYRDIKRLNVRLNDDVRAVFDRLVATDEEIRAANEAQNYVELFTTPEAAGLSAEEFAVYRGVVEKARLEAEETLTQQVLAELTREQKAWWTEERDKIQAEVTAEAYQNPVYRALAFLQRGKNPDGTVLEGVEPVKLSRAALIEQYGKDFLKTLPKPYVYAAEGGVAPDVVAGMFGFDSGDSLVKALVGARPLREAVATETAARMKAKHGDMLVDGTMVEKAMDAVHNEMRADLLAAELKALRRLERQVAPVLRARDVADARARREAASTVPGKDERRLISQAAAQAIGGMKVRDIRPHQYRIAESKASRLAFQAASKGDYQTAYLEKRKQLLNHELFRAASAAVKEAEKIRNYMRGFDVPQKRAALGKAGADYLEQIDAIRERFDFRRLSGPASDKRLALSAWVAEQQKAGREINLPAWLLDEARRVPYKELTYEELQGVRDVVVNIDHLSKLKNRLLASADERAFDDATADIADSIDRNHKRKDAPFEFAPSFREKIAHGMRRAMAEHTKLEFLFSWLDGEKDLGPVWQRLFKPLADAENQEQTMQREAREKLHEIFHRYTAKERWQMYHHKVFVDEIGKSMNKATLLAAALNVGNQYNRDVLLKGYKWSDAQLRALLTRLDDRDWETVQMIWDFIDGYWPEISRLQKDLTGLVPAKVERLPFQAPTGRQMAGGYYPIVYDSRLSWRQSELDETASVTELYGGAYTRVSTRHGHTIERTNSGGKAVKLDLGVMTNHVVNVIHDLTHRRALLDVDRLVTDDKVREAIEQTAGREMYGQLRPWLKSIAADFRPHMTATEGLLNHLRGGATVVSMGLKITTALVQPLGYFQSVDLLGPKYSAIGLREVYAKGDPVRSLTRAREFAFERSEQIRNRMKTFDRDIRDQLKGLTETASTAPVRRGFFFLTGLLDMSVALPTWMGAYRKAMDGAAEGIMAGDERMAIDYADSIVRKSQSAGGAKDLAGIQAGHPLLKLFTTFYSYFNVLYNLLQKRFRQMNWNRPADYPRFVASMLALWFVPAVLSEIVAGRGPDDDEPFDEYLKRTAYLWGLYPLQSIVLVRDVANAVGPWGYDGPPALDAIEQTGKTLGLPEGGGAALGGIAGAAVTRSVVGTAIGAAVGGTIGALSSDEELTRSDVKNALLAASYWGHLPGRQMWISGSYLYDWATGEEDPETIAEFMEGLAFARQQ